MAPFDSTDPNKAHALNALISRVVKAQCDDVEGIDVWGSGVANPNGCLLRILPE